VGRSVCRYSFKIERNLRKTVDMGYLWDLFLALFGPTASPLLAKFLTWLWKRFFARKRIMIIPDGFVTLIALASDMILMRPGSRLAPLDPLV